MLQGYYLIAPRAPASRSKSAVDIRMFLVFAFRLFNNIHMYTVDKKRATKGIMVVAIVDE